MSTNETPTTAIRRALDLQRAAFIVEGAVGIETRKARLQRVIDLVVEHNDALCEAMRDDFGGRPVAFSMMNDVLGSLAALKAARDHLHEWVGDQPRTSVQPFDQFGATAWLKIQPKGVVGIIGTWNFPLYLTLGPLVAALAAGNRAMIKISEFSPRCTALLTSMLAECFDEDEVAVCGGDIGAAQAFNALPFNHLVFTGSPRVGRQVMRAAAEHLTPVTLELGGKSPAIVGPDADLRESALRIAHGKAFNAGQICVAPDYALVPRGKAEAFAAAVADAFTRLYPTVSGNAEYTSIITERHAVRLRELLADAQAKGATLLRCGADAGSGRQMPLTVVTRVEERMQLMQEELFGPILPVLEYDSLDDAMALVRRGERPLSLYGLGLSAADQARVLKETHAGGVTFNDWGWHVFQHDLPFGGIGNSGMGTYHGEEGFRELSHAKGVFKRHRWFPVGLFYPPYGNLVQRLAMKFFIGSAPTPTRPPR